jgi:hypothetical protein
VALHAPKDAESPRAAAREPHRAPTARAAASHLMHACIGMQGPSAPPKKCGKESERHTLALHARIAGGRCCAGAPKKINALHANVLLDLAADRKGAAAAMEPEALSPTPMVLRSGSSSLPRDLARDQHVRTGLTTGERGHRSSDARTATGVVQVVFPAGGGRPIRTIHGREIMRTSHGGSCMRPVWGRTEEIAGPMARPHTWVRCEIKVLPAGDRTCHRRSTASQRPST